MSKAKQEGEALEYLNPERALDAVIQKATEIIEESEKQGGERDPRTQLVVDILWQLNYHRKNLSEYSAQLEYLVK